jgi:predicted aspartyl protease
MNQAFNAKAGLILIEAEVSGPTGKAGATPVLDTGATGTSLNRDVLRSVGYDPDSATEFARMTTGTTVQTVPRLMIDRLSALGRHAIGLHVLAHSLPAGAAVDGLLGLDFFRALVLTIDFRAGQLTLT